MSDDCDYNVDSDEGKRASLNAKERKRRNRIKHNFKKLRDSLPGFAGQKSSRVQILKKAASYIQHVRVRNGVIKKEIEDLLRQTNILEDAILKLDGKAEVKNTKSFDVVVEKAQRYAVGDMTFGPTEYSLPDDNL